jgi:hypothetical protein
VIVIPVELKLTEAPVDIDVIGRLFSEMPALVVPVRVNEPLLGIFPDTLTFANVVELGPGTRKLPLMELIDSVPLVRETVTEPVLIVKPASVIVPDGLVTEKLPFPEIEKAGMLTLINGRLFNSTRAPDPMSRLVPSVAVKLPPAADSIRIWPTVIGETVMVPDTVTTPADVTVNVPVAVPTTEICPSTPPVNVPVSVSPV